MPEHKYISERFERRTYLKGTFKGKFIGQLDVVKSDDKHERFFDLEIMEGEIYTTQDNVIRWMDGNEHGEFVNASRFSTRLPGEIRVTLQYLDGSIKHFAVKLQELKLIRCRLTNQVYQGNEVLGTIEGDVSGYLLHYDTVIQEIKEVVVREKIIPVTRDTSTISTAQDTTRQSPPITAAPTRSLGKRLFTYLRGSVSKNIYTPPFRIGCLPMLGLLVGFSLLAGFTFIFKHWILFLLFILIGFLIIRSAYNWISGIFNFQLTKRVATILSVILFTITIYLLVKFYRSDTQEAAHSKIAAEAKQKNDLQQQKSAKQNKDSFNYYFNTAITFCKQHTYEKALANLGRASLFASAADKNLITTERTAILNIQAEALVKKEQYTESISIYTELITLNRSSPAFFYKRAESYISLDKIQEAVTDLKKAIALGDKPAMLLHEKINPIKKRITGTITLCCDGTTSDATGQGACSHHGGVCEWAHPVYEEYRKYE